MVNANILVWSIERRGGVSHSPFQVKIHLGRGLAPSPDPWPSGEGHPSPLLTPSSLPDPHPCPQNSSQIYAAECKSYLLKIITPNWDIILGHPLHSTVSILFILTWGEIFRQWGILLYSEHLYVSSPSFGRECSLGGIPLKMPGINSDVNVFLAGFCPLSICTADKCYCEVNRHNAQLRESYFSYTKQRRPIDRQRQ